MSSRHRLRVIAGSMACLFGANMLGGCAKDWTAFRHNGLRDAHQPRASKLSNPAQVTTLHVATGWPFHPPGAQAFRASPIVQRTAVLAPSSARDRRAMQPWLRCCAKRSTEG